MRTLDRLRRYILELRQAGKLHPGDKLPSFRELEKSFDASYVTIHNAMAQLQHEGVVKIDHGNGTYLSGGHPLKVQFRYAFEFISPSEFERLLRKALAGKDLNFLFEFKSIWEKPQYDKETIVITIGGKNTNLNANISDFSNQEGYYSLLKELEAPEQIAPWMPLPFCMTTFQFALNKNILKKINFPQPAETGNFNWWDAYAQACKKCGFLPASISWGDNTLWHFESLTGLLLALNNGKTDNLSNGAPLFDSAIGRRLLSILKDTVFCPINVTNPDKRGFMLGGAGASFKVGSWISVQNNNSRYPYIKLNGLKLIPYSAEETRIYPTSISYMYPSLPVGLGVEERHRVWQLIELLLSRPFQKDFCGASGTISVRKDFAPNDYEWNTGEAWAQFIPGSEDRKIYEENLFTPEIRAALTVLIDIWKSSNIDAEFILSRMDAKKNVYLNEYQYLHD